VSALTGCRAVVGIDWIWTEFHHDEDKYDLTKALKYIELCITCPAKETWRLSMLAGEDVKKKRLNHPRNIRIQTEKTSM
jgi:hypothetical protein